MVTGLTPRGHGVRTNGIPLRRDLPTMPQALVDAGYHTASVGKLHLSNYGLSDAADSSKMGPDEFPELTSHWESEAITRMIEPYFGFEHVRITLGHATWVWGDYVTWLKTSHPKLWEKFEAQKVVPHPSGAEGCGRFTLDEEHHHTAWVANESIDYLQNRDKDKPFFLWTSFPDPHHAYHVPEPWDSMYDPADVVPPVGRDGELDDLAPFFREIYENELQLSGRKHPTRMPDEHRRVILAHTYGMISLLDKHVGRILDELDEQGLADNTVVAFISDHGDMMGDHGLLNKGPFHFEGLLRVPMIWRCPGQIPAAGTKQAMASLLDLPSTVLDMAGVPIPEGPTSPEAPKQPPAWPGRSLAPVLRGETDSVQDSVIVENDEDYLGLRLRTLITPTHKLTTYTDHRGPAPFGELFDLEEDPDELHNRWDDPRYRSLRAELTEKLHYRLTETDIAVPRRLSHA